MIGSKSYPFPPFLISFFRFSTAFIEVPDEFDDNDIEETLFDMVNDSQDRRVKVVAKLGEHGEWKNG